ncbi:MauE/DoxX family redox-associated membrane protein [Ktedonospora formicarum]|uniref:Methylamine utilisation protein MauE domain-containing protein n=1 Tax=Ktedonospora formicarum TaxID=2778364 RepID=A0A8J3I683_9CHLR|nr:MauE/DoxX family redox-associated membrane protein [Ktedonospora formicarum]GHO46129.1 hypothetical protein KSX_42920 [Ktedonospora formicarum]
MTALYIQAFCRIVIGLVFAISSFGKLRDIPKFQRAILGFRLLPRRLSRSIALFFLSGELTVVVFVTLGGPLLLSGFLLAALLLLMFSGALASVLVRRLQTNCNCFGASEKNVSTTDIWRNLGFLICAAGGCGAIFWTRNQQMNLGSIEWLLASLGALIFVLIWIQLGEIVQLFRLS